MKPTPNSLLGSDKGRRQNPKRSSGGKSKKQLREKAQSEAIKKQEWRSKISELNALKTQEVANNRDRTMPLPKKPVVASPSTQGYFGLLSKSDDLDADRRPGKIATNPKFDKSVGRISRAPIISQNTRGARVIARQYKGFRRGRLWGQRPSRSVSTQGTITKPVIKSRFQTNGSRIDSEGKLQAHLLYLEKRKRGEIEKESDRRFFNRNESGARHDEVFQKLSQRFSRSVAYHKIIVSPGDNSLHLEHYTREIMSQWQKELGKELEWWAIAHKNTNHYHTHVVVAGLTKNGQRVTFDKEDLALLRETADRYLVQDRMLERHLDRNVEFKLRELLKDWDIDMKLMDLQPSRIRDWQDLVATGQRTQEDYIKEWRLLGLNQVYNLGRPFENLKQTDSKDLDKDQGAYERSTVKQEPVSPDQTSLEASTSAQNQVAGGDVQPGGGLNQHANTVLEEKGVLSPLSPEEREEREHDDNFRR